MTIEMIPHLEKKLVAELFTLSFFLSGTHGVMTLEDVNGKMVEIYLHNRNQLPVPR